MSSNGLAAQDLAPWPHGQDCLGPGVAPHQAMLTALRDNLRVTHASANLETILGSCARSAPGGPPEDVVGGRVCAALIVPTPADPVTHSLRATTALGQTELPHVSARHLGRHVRVEIERVDPVAEQAPSILTVAPLLASLREAQTCQALIGRAIHALQALTRYDRIVAYRFHDNGNGSVFLDTDLPGLSAPPVASFGEISQAPTAGTVADADAPTMAPLTDSDWAATALHTFSHDSTPLMAFSHRAYLRSMNARAGLKIGLLQDDSKPWGMLMCLHATTRVATPALRATVETIATTVSLRLATLYASESARRAEKERVTQTRYMTAQAEALRRAADALRVNEARLDHTQAVAGIGSWELDPTTGHITWSAEARRIRALSPADSQPTVDTLTLDMHPSDVMSVKCWLSALAAGREQQPREARIIRPDGEVRVVRLEAKIERGPDRSAWRLAGTMQDITERRRLEHHLMQATRIDAIGNLTSGLVHDFNNLLSVVVGNLDLLQRSVATDPAAADLCHDALDAATRGAGLIRRLLAFARRQALSPQPTDVNALVSDLSRLLDRLLGDNIVMKLNLDASPWQVMVDPSQLEAALINLATNARQAMPGGGCLSIKTSMVHLDFDCFNKHQDGLVGDYALIEITDTGTGIAPEIIGRIFEPFFTTKSTETGTGLGLAMVFGFAKQSGGHLSVQSDPGTGTTFRLYLPRIDRSASQLPCLVNKGEPTRGNPFQAADRHEIPPPGKPGRQDALPPALQAILETRDISTFRMTEA